MMIVDKLNECMKRDDALKIEDWLFIFHEGRGLNLGLQDSKIGGPYKNPAISEIYEGGIYIRWHDSSVSKGKIDAQTLKDLNKAVKEWKRASYFDKDAAEIIEPQPIPKLKIMDKMVKTLVYENSLPLFEIFNNYCETLGSKPYTKTMQGEIGIEYRTTTIKNSKGMNHIFDGTKYMVMFAVNESVGGMYSKRKLPWKKDLDGLVRKINFFMKYKGKKVGFKKRKMDVILLEDEIDSFIETFILENLDGSAVANKSSAYSLQDFSSNKQVFRKDVNIVIDGLKEWSEDVNPCTSEGVPARKQELIADGKLITPTLDLKYAKKLGLPPTPGGEIILEVDEKVKLSDLVKRTKIGVIVQSILGMHTQSPKEGYYSLPIVMGLLVEDGKIKGEVKGVMAGNFFEALNDPSTVFGSYGDELIMKFKSNVTPQ